MSEKQDRNLLKEFLLEYSVDELIEHLKWRIRGVERHQCVDVSKENYSENYPARNGEVSAISINEAYDMSIHEMLDQIKERVVGLSKHAYLRLQTPPDGRTHWGDGTESLIWHRRKVYKPHRH